MKEGKIKMEGFVEIWNGKTHIKAKNHFVDQMLSDLTSGFIGNQDPVSGLASAWTIKTGGFMVLGTNTATVTTHGMSALTAPIGGAPGTKPDTQSFSNTNPSGGVYRSIFTVVWNAGNISGTVGEIGLYLYNNTMKSRLSNADSDFTSFVIDDTVPLTIAWTIQFSFA